jgi:hypothetical protein
MIDLTLNVPQAQTSQDHVQVDYAQVNRVTKSYRRHDEVTLTA